jgi:hypothetical protein
MVVYDAAIQGREYPGPQGGSQQEDAQATTSTDPSSLMNPLNLLPSGTQPHQERVRNESAMTPTPEDPILQPSPDAEVPLPKNSFSSTCPTRFYMQPHLARELLSFILLTCVTLHPASDFGL